MTQDHPLDNTQTEAHRVYDDMVTKYRDALRAVRDHVNSKSSWVELMKSSTMDDGPEVAVDIHLENPPVSGLVHQNKDQKPSYWCLGFVERTN